MSNQMMPWSIKGVSDDARARAKFLAQTSGQTMGAWLSELILSMEADDAPTPPGQGQLNGQATTAAPVVTGPNVAELAELMLAMARRVATLEKDTAEFAASFQDQLSDLRHRLRRAEQAQSIPAAVSSTVFSDG